MKKGKQLTALLTAAFILPATAATVFNGGDVTDGLDWDNGLPSAGNDGTINTDGNLGAGTFNSDGNVTHTGGTLTVTSFDNIIRGGGTWTQTGGTFAADRQFFLGQSGSGTDFSLESGDITFGGNGGSRFLLSSGSSLSQSGGTITGGGFDADGASTISLTGGSVTNFGGLIGSQAYWVRDGGSSISISGDHSTTFASTGITGDGMVLLDGGGTLDFAADWTGFWEIPNYNEAQWITQLDDSGITVGGTQVTAGNFNDLFVLSDNEDRLQVVPEPSSTVLIGLAGMGLLLRRRR